MGGVEGISKDKKFACYHCKEWFKANWKFSPFISFVGLAMYPSPCQCRCSYCGVNKRVFDKNEDNSITVTYERIFEMLRFARNQKILAPKGYLDVQVACGEITIHPYKEHILDLVKGDRVRFCTNAFVFDRNIALELHNNPKAIIEISLDSGTAETWHKVKGVDNFRVVLENLSRYRQYSARAGQIAVKYIILPSINDSMDDFISCVNILKSLDVTNLILSRDLRVVNAPDIREQSANNEILDRKCIDSAARLTLICRFNGIGTTMLNIAYTQKEKESILRLANKFINSLGHKIPY